MPRHDYEMAVVLARAFLAQNRLQMPERWISFRPGYAGMREWLYERAQWGVRDVREWMGGEA
jgi:hypothetical protein